jgi:hypothetical protein
VGELVGGPNLFDAERLLADYCLVRRNPLSAVAAVEAALLTCKVCVGGRGWGKDRGGLGADGTETCFDSQKAGKQRRQQRCRLVHCCWVRRKQPETWLDFQMAARCSLYTLCLALDQE